MKTKRIIALLLAAVMLFAFTACKEEPEGKDQGTTPGTLYAGLDNVYEDANLKAIYLEKPERFKENAKAEFGLTDDEIQSFFSESDKWGFYSLYVSINNNTDKSHTFISYKTSETPDGMWISSVPANGELSVAMNTTDTIFPINVLINLDKITLNQMYAAAANLDIDLYHYETLADDDIIVPESEWKTLKVTNNMVAPEDDTVKAEDQISAKRTTIEDASGYLEAFRSNSAAFANESKLYGMDSETAAKVIAEGSGWECYLLNIEIVNKTDDDLTVNKVIAANNGETGVWVCSLSEFGEFGMPANDKQILPVNVFVDPSALGGKTAQEAIAQMQISLEYVAGELIDDEGNESLLPSKIVNVK